MVIIIRWYQFLNQLENFVLAHGDYLNNSNTLVKCYTTLKYEHDSVMFPILVSMYYYQFTLKHWIW